MELCEGIRFLAGPEHRVALLEILELRPANKDDLADQLSVSKSTIDRSLTNLAALGWIRETQEGTAITSAGRVVLREHERVLNAIDREGFEFLGGSKKGGRPLLLRAVKEPAGKSELAREYHPSRSTVGRVVDDLEEREWVAQRNSGQYAITPAGEEAIDAFDDLVRAVMLIKEKAGFLEHFEVDPAPPLYVLEYASEKSSTRDVIHRGLHRFLEIVKTRPSHIRSISFFITKPFNRIGQRLLERGIESEHVLDENALKTLKEDYPGYFEFSLNAEALDLYVHPNKIGFAMAIFDAEQVLLGVYDEHGNLRGGVDGADEDLVAWAVELFERYRDEARLVTEQSGPEH